MRLGLFDALFPLKNSVNERILNGSSERDVAHKDETLPTALLTRRPLCDIGVESSMSSTYILPALYINAET